ncbi:unnamed protein product [Macrosiphum euphorbiae]|uniref:Uncharacterized protein n=1 Tax=Macrosiphum euphorbiae TaxID=13131 RepID=A0AAV0VHP7_9HEMI|nr:unnamed protein product [Macrosiphum euphorbiae]
MYKEPATQRKRRLERARIKYQEKKANEGSEAKRARLDKNRQAKKKLRAEETPSMKNKRLLQQRENRIKQRDKETPESGEARRQAEHERYLQRAAAENPERRESRKQADHERYLQRCAAQTNQDRGDHLENIRRQWLERSASEIEFEKAINTFCDQFCEVCTKRCYPNQVSILKLSNYKPNYLPIELLQKKQLLLCHRCKTHLSSRKTTAPPKAFWNKLDPGVIPNEIHLLSQAEKRLLSILRPTREYYRFAHVD